MSVGRERFIKSSRLSAPIAHALHSKSETTRTIRNGSSRRATFQSATIRSECQWAGNVLSKVPVCQHRSRTPCTPSPKQLERYEMVLRGGLLFNPPRSDLNVSGQGTFYQKFPFVSTDRARLALQVRNNSNDTKWFFAEGYFSIRHDQI